MEKINYRLGFTAKESLCTTSGQYYMATNDAAFPIQVVPQWTRVPTGLCAKACRLCPDPMRGGMWCDICDRCFENIE
jgi:hypothetical protein